MLRDARADRLREGEDESVDEVDTDGVIDVEREVDAVIVAVEESDSSEVSDEDRVDEAESDSWAVRLGVVVEDCRTDAVS